MMQRTEHYETMNLIYMLDRETSNVRISVCGRMFSRSVVAEIKGLFTLAWPPVLSYLSHHLVFMISTFFAGRLGEVELAAGTLAISFINVTGPSIFHGLCFAMETLSSQAYSLPSLSGKLDIGLTV